MDIRDKVTWTTGVTSWFLWVSWVLVVLFCAAFLILMPNED
ncbi:MAG: hypothetical protein ACYC1C_15210 [Chloroflexota bacterium]